jgi:hypothetical protein
MIPEANHAIAMLRQFVTAQLVLERICMLTAIELDHELARWARKIGNSSSNRVLSTKLPGESILLERIHHNRRSGFVASRRSLRATLVLSRSGTTPPHLASPPLRGGEASQIAGLIFESG